MLFSGNHFRYLSAGYIRDLDFPGQYSALKEDQRIIILDQAEQNIFKTYFIFRLDFIFHFDVRGEFFNIDLSTSYQDHFSVTQSSENSLEILQKTLQKILIPLSVNPGFLKMPFSRCVRKMRSANSGSLNGPLSRNRRRKKTDVTNRRSISAVVARKDRWEPVI